MRTSITGNQFAAGHVVVNTDNVVPSGFTVLAIYKPDELALISLDADARIALARALDPEKAITKLESDREYDLFSGKYDGPIIRDPLDSDGTFTETDTGEWLEVNDLRDPTGEASDAIDEGIADLDVKNPYPVELSYEAGDMLGYERGYDAGFSDGCAVYTRTKVS